MSDGTRSKITMPAWHVPYLEKHNIYKLFYEITRELVIHQPEDHVFFMKYLLASAVKNVHVPHVIILGSPKINMVEIGNRVAQETKLVMVTEGMILEILHKGSRDQLTSNEYMSGLQNIMNSHAFEIMTYGWLLVDCIKNKEDAQRLLDIGILPTHVFYFILPFSPNLNELLYCNVSSSWPEYRRAIFGIRQVYEKKLIEVHLNEFGLDDIVNKCVELINMERIEEGPKRPRVVILGPRGCGRKTQAKLLQTKFDIVHVDFEYLLCQAWISDSEIGRQLRSHGHRACFHPELLTKVLNKRLLDPDCLSKGWVLTGYPFSVKDFKYIDCLETPPNRVIFLECDLNVCSERLVNRRVDVYTGSVTKIQIDYDEISVQRLHPKDKEDIVNAELRYFCTQYGALRKYCGLTAAVINADQPERWVHESIMAVIMRDLPISLPRNPFDDQDGVHLSPRSSAPYKYFHYE